MLVETIMTKLMMIAAVLGFSACVAETDAQPGSSEIVARTIAETDHVTGNELILPATVDAHAEESNGRPGRIEVCNLEPQDGPCALACDPKALGKEYVPVGQCALFLCETPDGEPVKVGACNNP